MADTIMSEKEHEEEEDKVPLVTRPDRLVKGDLWALPGPMGLSRAHTSLPNLLLLRVGKVLGTLRRPKRGSLRQEAKQKALEDKIMLDTKQEMIAEAIQISLQEAKATCSAHPPSGKGSTSAFVPSPDTCLHLHVHFHKLPLSIVNVEVEDASQVQSKPQMGKEVSTPFINVSAAATFVLFYTNAFVDEASQYINFEVVAAFEDHLDSASETYPEAQSDALAP
ncbi:hypothetical protein Fmac_011452 [Flemingia macrophylla]|uniref:Uncharacterized protein n=1 Tax=Flemingia macrophylla TaxID=520843 RepID=A0ABD1MMT0_9FABA